MAQLGQEQDLLRAIDSARVRLDQGVANVRITCGQDIPDERLLAMPPRKPASAASRRLKQPNTRRTARPCSASVADSGEA